MSCAKGLLSATEWSWWRPKVGFSQGKQQPPCAVVLHNKGKAISTSTVAPAHVQHAAASKPMNYHIIYTVCSILYAALSRSWGVDKCLASQRSCTYLVCMTLVIVPFCLLVSNARMKGENPEPEGWYHGFKLIVHKMPSRTHVFRIWHIGGLAPVQVPMALFSHHTTNLAHEAIWRRLSVILLKFRCGQEGHQVSDATSDSTITPLSFTELFMKSLKLVTVI